MYKLIEGVLPNLFQVKRWRVCLEPRKNKKQHRIKYIEP